MRKNKKNILLNTVLSLCLCLSLFFGSCMSADAAYITGRFPFSMKEISSQTFTDYPYLYIFNTQDFSHTENAGHSPASVPSLFHFYFGNLFYCPQYLAVFSDTELFLSDNDSSYNRPLLLLGAKNSGVNVVLYQSGDSVSWSFNKSFAFSGSSFEKQKTYGIVFDPRKVLVMSSHHLRHYQTDAILYQKNILDAWIEEQSNASYVTEPDSVDISNNSSSSVEILPEESDGTPWGNLWSHFAKVINGIAGIGVKIDNFKDACIDRFLSGMDKTRIAVLDVLDNVKDLPSAFVQSIKEGKIFDPFNVLFDGVNLKILDVIDYVKNLPREIGKILSQDGLFGLLETVIDKISEIRGWIWENPLVQSVTDIVSSVWDIGESLINIPVEVGKVFRTVFEELFVLRGDYLQGKMEGLADRFPFISSAKSIVFSIGTRIKELGANPPVITIPLSKTFLASYGVTDCTMTFEWFAPYRSIVLLTESTFLWCAFAFRLYFGVKHIFNATSNVMPYMYVESWRS